MAIKIKINYWCDSLRIYYKLFNFFGHLSATLPWHRLALLDWLLDWLVLARLLWHLCGCVWIYIIFILVNDLYIYSDTRLQEGFLP